MEALETGIRIPCGIADRSCEFGYVSTAAGITQLLLDTGQQQWSTEEPGQPVAVSGTELFALRLAQDRSTMRLISFDTSRGPQPLSVSETIAIPQMADSLLDSIDVESQGSVLVFRWVVHRFYKGGAPPPEHIKLRESETSVATVRVDVRSGTVIDAITTIAEPRFSRAPGELDMSSDGNWRSDPWRLDGATATLILSTLSTGEQTLAIEIAPHDQPKAESISLATGTALIPTVSLDRRHVLVRDDGPDAKRADWLVFSIDERTRVATVTYEEDTRDASICGGRLVYLVKQLRPPQTTGARGNIETMLKARDLAGNRMLWTFGLRAEASIPPRLRP